MRIGMNKCAFRREWLSLFASDLPKQEVKRKAGGKYNYIWHIFSWNLVSPENYLAGDLARQAYGNANKTDAWCFRPFENNATVKIMDLDDITAEQIDAENEIYIVSKDYSWTYIKTHENDLCGPYFYQKR